MPTEFAALVAIDWADQNHAWALQAGTSKVETGAIDHTPEAIDVWAAELRMRFGGQAVAVALEQSRGPLVFMLTKYDHLVIFPVHPTVLVNYRKSFRPSGAKDDPSDARLLLDILVLHRDKLRRFNPDTAETRTLQFLVEERRKFVHEKTRYSNRITSHLKMYFPQVLDWFDEIGSNIAAEFLGRWPSLEKLQRARPTTVERFFIDHNSRNTERIKERLDQIRKAVPATTDVAVVTSSSAAVLGWAALLKEVLTAISDYDQQINELAQAHPDYALVKSFPGAGPAMAPRLIAAMGSQRERYQSDRTSAIQRNRSRARQQRQTALGALAVGVPEVPTPNVPRVGAPLDRILRLGPPVLRAAAREGQAAQYRDPLARVQMDSHPLPLLEGSQAVRRGRVSTSIDRTSAESTAHRCACRTPVEKRRWLQKDCPRRGLTDDLRCLSSAAVRPRIRHTTMRTDHVLIKADRLTCYQQSRHAETVVSI